MIIFYKVQQVSYSVTFLKKYIHFTGSGIVE